MSRYFGKTKEKCEDFLEKTELSFVDFISVLNYIFRWVLPFRNVYLKQLVEPKNEVKKRYIDRLRERDVKFNLDILEYGRTREGRKKKKERERGKSIYRCTEKANEKLNNSTGPYIY